MLVLSSPVGHVEVQPSTQLSSTGQDTPSCTNHYIPCVGERFKSYENARKSYFDYASCVGFNVRKGSTKIVDGKLVLRRFLCCKEGYPNIHSKTSSTRKRKIRAVVRCGCEAMIRISRVDDTEMWEVGLFVEKHNHDLTTPLKKRNIP